MAGRLKQRAVVWLIMGMAGLSPLTAQTETRLGPEWNWLKGREARILRQLEAAVDTERNGARAILKGREIKRFSLRDVQDQVRKKSLDIQNMRHLLANSEYAIEEADAVFSPNFSFNLGYSVYRTKRRADQITRYRKRDEDWDAFEEAFGTDKLTSGDTYCVASDGEVLAGTCTSPVISTQLEYASSYMSHWGEIWSGSVGASKLFDWGGAVSLSLETELLPYVTTKSASVTGLAFATDLGTKEWTSSLAASFSTPLPYFKNFGALGSASAVNLKLAEFGLERAKLTLSNTENQALQNVSAAYWDLVRSLMNVASAQDYRQRMNQMVARTERLVEAENATQYERIQAFKSLTSARNREEMAWNNLIQQSNAEYLDLPPNQFPVPTDIIESLNHNPGADMTDSLKVALSQRFDLKALRSDVESADLYKRHKRRQLNPDLSMQVSHNVGQSNAVWGYNSIGESLKELFDPDTRSTYVGFTLSIPLGNQDGKAQLARSKSDLQQAEDQVRNQEVAVTQEINALMTQLDSAQAAVGLARRNLGLSLSALGTAKRLISQFEYLQRHSELFSARAALIDAQIALQKAKVNLLAARGDLNQAGWTDTALNEGEGS